MSRNRDQEQRDERNQTPEEKAVGKAYEALCEGGAEQIGIIYKYVLVWVRRFAFRLLDSGRDQLIEAVVDRLLTETGEGRIRIQEWLGAKYEKYIEDRGICAHLKTRVSYLVSGVLREMTMRKKRKTEVARVSEVSLDGSQRWLLCGILDEEWGLVVVIDVSSVPANLHWIAMVPVTHGDVAEAMQNQTVDEVQISVDPSEEPECWYQLAASTYLPRSSCLPAGEALKKITVTEQSGRRRLAVPPRDAVSEKLAMEHLTPLGLSSPHEAADRVLYSRVPCHRLDMPISELCGEDPEQTIDVEDLAKPLEGTPIIHHRSTLEKLDELKRRAGLTGRTADAYDSYVVAFFELMQDESIGEVEWFDREHDSRARDILQDEFGIEYSTAQKYLKQVRDQLAALELSQFRDLLNEGTEFDEDETGSDDPQDQEGSNRRYGEGESHEQE